MFKDEFVMGGKNPYVRDKIIKLYRWSGLNKTILEDFKKSIEPHVMAWMKSCSIAVGMESYTVQSLR